MMDPELRELRRRLDSIPRGRGRRIPVELRTQVIAWVAKHRKRGDSWSELVEKTGVSLFTLQRWSSSPAQRAVMLRRVEVVEAAPADAPADAPAERTVTLVSPTGIRIEGITIAEVIAILRGLA